MNQVLIDRIDARLQALGMSDRKASMLAVQKPDLIRDIRRGKRRSELTALARALQTTPDYLEGLTDKPGRADAPTTVIPNPFDLDRDIPVFGTALGAPSDLWGGDIAIEQVDLNTGEVVDLYRRPPSLRDRRDVYVLYVTGDSLVPAKEPGEAVLIDPKQPPALRDYVVVYLRGGDDAVVSVLIKRLVRRSASYVELEQYNPATTFQVDSKAIVQMHRVKPWDEAYGF